MGGGYEVADAGRFCTCCSRDSTDMVKNPCFLSKTTNLQRPLTNSKTSRGESRKPWPTQRLRHHAAPPASKRNKSTSQRVATADFVLEALFGAGSVLSCILQAGNALPWPLVSQPPALIADASNNITATPISVTLPSGRFAGIHSRHRGHSVADLCTDRRRWRR